MDEKVRMKSIGSLQKYAIYAYFFSLNFERMDLFNLGIDYLSSKITIVSLILISLFNYKKNFNIFSFSKYFWPLFIYFIVLTVIGYLNKSPFTNDYFDIPFFLNIVVLVILSNSSKADQNVLLKGFYWFAFGTVILSVLFFLNISVSDKGYEGRSSVFGLNQNVLGVMIVISLFTLNSIIFGKSEISKRIKTISLIAYPFLFVFMVSTGSRTAFLSFMLGVILFILFNKYIRKSRKILFLIFSSIIFILIFLFYLKDSLVFERLSTTVNEGDLSARDLIWIAISKIVTNNIWFGVGKTGYAIEINQIFYEIVSPHNVIIETLCYTGLLGLSIISVFLYRVIKIAFIKMKMNNMLFIMLLIPVFANIISGQVYENKLPWIIFALIISSNSENLVKIQHRKINER